jgi:tetratricopeptide (TPR) repeat protein
MTAEKIPSNQPGPVISAHLGKLLGAVFLLFALLVVNSLYLVSITMLEQASGEIYQDYFYMLMFLVHLGLGLLLTLPFILFGLGHMRRALGRPNRYAVRAGLSLFSASLVLLLTGLVLARFGFFEVNDPLARGIAYWLHIISPFAVAWLFVLHRLAGPPIRWRAARNWSFIAAAFAALMIGSSAMISWLKDTSVPISFKPSLAKLEATGYLPPEHLMNDETCADCHGDINDSHEHSMHRFSSFNNPAYKFSVEETREVVYKRDGNMHAARFCAACHDPVPLFSGRFDSPEYDTENDPTAMAGITCMSCHAITEIDDTYGTGNYTLVDPPRYPFAFSESGLLRAINHQLIKSKPAFHRKTLLKPLHRSAEFCSTCHKTHIPESVNHYRWLRAQNHYDSFLQSGVSGHRVDSFYYPPQAVPRCSTCHMPLQASDDPAARDFNNSGKRHVHSHQFPAANTGVAHMVGLPESVIEAHRKRLTGVTRIDIFGIKEGGHINGELHAPLRPKLPALVPGEKYLLEMVVRTTGVGHHLTQGTSDSNQLWLDVTATAGDRVIGRSGARDDTGSVDPWSYFLNSYVLDRDGNRIDRRNGQDIFVPLYNHQIPPGAATVVHYLLEVPADTREPVVIEASLNYRKFDTTYMQHMLGDEFTVNDLPITTMASDRIELPVGRGQDDMSFDLHPVAENERWNDYGIGLLRQGDSGSNKGELRQAEQAFRQVEVLGDMDGAMNLARVYFKEGRVDEASQALRRATAGDPPAPHWTIAWYTALIDRENGHLDEAIHSLESIIDTRFEDARQRGFDFSKDVRVTNMLGRTLFERARLERGEARREARMAFLERSVEALHRTLDTDPENLAAHYNLGLVYAETGDDAKAAHHRALHEKYRPDDNAVERAVAIHRSRNPAADHAASPVAIYDLGRAPSVISAQPAAPAATPPARKPVKPVRWDWQKPPMIRQAP